MFVVIYTASWITLKRKAEKMSWNKRWFTVFALIASMNGAMAISESSKFMRSALCFVAIFCALLAIRRSVMNAIEIMKNE